MNNAIPQGGIVICRPAPISVKPGFVQGLTLMSDMHVGARNVDYKLIDHELEEAKKHNDRILINGDIFDMILIQDMKRFRADVLHPRLVGKADLVNAAIEWGVEILGPYADLIDMAGCGNHECFDASTECLTTDGWIPFPFITLKHKVASYNIPKNSIEFSEPTHVHDYHYDGEMVSIVNQHVDLLVTPNHRILMRASATRKSSRRVRGEGCIAKINNGWRACRRINGKTIYATVRHSIEEAECDRISISDSSVEHFIDRWKMIHAVNLPKISMDIRCAANSDNEEFPAADNEIRAAAWILTDGWLSKKGSVAICQRVSKSHMVRDVLKACGWNFTENTRERNITSICGKLLKKRPEPSVEFHIHDSGRVRARELVPHKARLPQWLWSLSKRQFDIFLQSYIDGDGSRHISAPATSLMVYGRKHLMDDLHALCVNFGYRCTLVEYRPAAWRLNIHPSQTTKLMHDCVKREPYFGSVYCVTTNNGTVVVRRNGKVSVTGNSAVEKYHSTDVLKILVYELNRHRKNKKHIIYYGGYGGFVDYRFQSHRPGGQKHGCRFVIYYHHGSGGAAPITKGMIDFSRKSWAHADVIWMGHKHNRLASAIQTLECPIIGYEPMVKEVRHVMSGAYFDTYCGQTQESVAKHGRLTNYAADMGLAPQGKGGARITLTFQPCDRPLVVKVIQ